jgi:hypothetical protein
MIFSENRFPLFRIMLSLGSERTRAIAAARMPGIGNIPEIING